MARKPSALAVIYHRRATEALKQIWNWNAEKYHAQHADEYLKFLTSSIDKLVLKPALGKPVPNRPDFQFLIVKRASRGHGHVAIYRSGSRAIEVMEVFHTAQDWQAYVQNLS
jgi:plasmid stabilization system protein ParE